MKPEILNDCPQVLRDFLFYMETIKGRSSKTVSEYYLDLRTYLRYLKCVKITGVNPFQLTVDEFREISIQDIPTQLICSVTLSDIYGYLNFVLDQRQNSAKTRSRKVTSIRSFYKYLNTKTELLPVNPAKDLEVPSIRKSIPKYLTLEESVELLSSIDANKNPRDYCMIVLLLNCGMRVSELVGINTQDIRDNTLKLLGKGNKERVVYLNDACISALKGWMDVRTAPSSGKDRNAVFLGRGGKRLTTRRVEQILEGYLKPIGLSGKGYSPHKLRHTAATLMYQNGGVDVRILKEILGHANLATTEIYTHISDRQLEKAAESSPLANFNLNQRKNQRKK